MFRLLRSSTLLGWLVIALSIIIAGGVVTWTGTLNLIFGTGGTPHIFGSFSPFGNAGEVTLMTVAQENVARGSWLYLDSTNNTLTGNIFLQTVGFAEFGRAWNVDVTPPGDTLNVLEPWKLSGFVWSENAGWMTLQSLNESAYSWVAYLPASNSFTGYAWSDTLGYIGFDKAEGYTSGFIGAVKVLWNIAGGKAFNILAYNPGQKFDSVTFTPFLNETRKNIALLTRSLPQAKYNIIPWWLTMVNGMRYYKLSGWTVVSGNGVNYKFWDFGTDKVQVIVVEGGDFSIDNNIWEDSYSKPRIVYVLKNSAGSWGNVFIGPSVTKIHTSIVAEWSIYSGAPGNLLNDTQAKLTSLPDRQLYIKGSLISRNTIGGSAFVTSASCPYNVTLCDRTTAIKYDFNYFRAFRPGSWERAFLTPRVFDDGDSSDNYSLIIDYDQRMLKDPPPGLN